MKSSSKALLWIVLVFVVGAAFGATATMLIIRSRIASATFLEGNAARRGSAQARREGFGLRQMLRQLQLDPEQEVKVRAILEKTKERYQTIEQEKNHDLRQERRRTITEIREVLRPEQQERLDEFLRRVSNRRKDPLRE